MFATTRRSIRIRARSVVAALGVVVAAVTIPLATAAPASADQLHCVDYLRREGVLVGPKVVDACNKGASEEFAVQQLCFPSLVKAGLSAPKADRACTFASEF
ncbi:hypothetical protein [Pseudonocardia sp. DLS-67]